MPVHYTGTTEISGEAMSPDNRFVCRMMCAKCSYGNMTHPLNVEVSEGGHGVLFGPDAQPVLNANDWKAGVNVIHFGDCSPRIQDENGQRLVDKLPGWVKFFSDVAAFFTAKKCTPMIQKVWYETDGKYLIDGAPVLLMRSLLFCKRGGIITIVPPAFADDAEDAPDNISPSMEEVNAQVAAAVDQALREGKIDDATAGFLKEGYREALAFTHGDVETANRLFSDLARRETHDLEDGDYQYATSAAEYEKFMLFLDHKNVDLNGRGSSGMELTSGDNGRISLDEALETAFLNDQRVAASLNENGQRTVPVELSEYIAAEQRWEESKYTYYDDFGEKHYLPNMPDRVTAPPDPDNAFSFLDESDIPSLFKGANVSTTAVQIADSVASNPTDPIVLSMLNGLG